MGMDAGERYVAVMAALFIASALIGVALGFWLFTLLPATV